MHQLKWNSSPEALPPVAHRQMVAVYEDDVRPLDLVGAENADVVNKRHLPVLTEPYEVDDVRNNEVAVVAGRSNRSISLVYDVIDVKVDADVLKYDAVVIEHYTQIHASHNK